MIFAELRLVDESPQSVQFVVVPEGGAHYPAQVAVTSLWLKVLSARVSPGLLSAAGAEQEPR